MEETTSTLLGTASAIAIGAYLVTVVFRGNTTALLDLLKNETGYVDFIVALFILGALSKFGPSSKINDFFIVATLIGLALRAGANINFLPAIRNFANGNAGILQTLKNIISPSTVGV